MPHTYADHDEALPGVEVMTHIEHDFDGERCEEPEAGVEDGRCIHGAAAHEVWS